MPTSHTYNKAQDPCPSTEQDKGHSAVVLKAMGRAINKTVTIGELTLSCTASVMGPSASQVLKQGSY